MTIAIISSNSQVEDEELEERFVVRCIEAASSQGVASVSLFSRQTPDGDPYASTLSGRQLAFFEVMDGIEPTALIPALETVSGGQAVGSFNRVSVYKKEGRESDLNAANGILVVMLNNGAPGQEKAFTEWYDGLHLQECVDASPFWVGARYQAVADQIPEGEARHMGLLETDMNDVVAAHHALLDEWPKMSQWPHKLVHCAAYERAVR